MRAARREDSIERLPSTGGRLSNLMKQGLPAWSEAKRTLSQNAQRKRKAKRKGKTKIAAT